VLLRQENDPRPKFIFLEEGPERIALRVLYSLYDDLGHYHGDGMQEVWIYRHGDIFLALGVRLVDQASHSVLQDAHIEIEQADRVKSVEVGASEPSILIGEELHTGAFFPFGQALPGKYVILDGERGHMALHWASDRGRIYNPVFWVDHKAPFYEKWPSFFDQWSINQMETMGWLNNRTSGLEVRGEEGGCKLRFCWARKAGQALGPRHDLRALLALSIGAGRDELVEVIRAHQEPISLSVEGGVCRCYDEQDGCYEIRKDAEEATVVLPASWDERLVRLRFFNLIGEGAIEVEVDGKPYQPQLISYGARTDDPLVPLLVESHGPADEALVVTCLRPDREVKVVLREGEGMNASYQMRDDRRNLVIFGTYDRVSPLPPGEGPLSVGEVIYRASHDRERGTLEFSLRDGKARHIRGIGKRKPAIEELPLHWLYNCAASPFHYVNILKSFKLLKNGPDEVIFDYMSVNRSERVRSEYIVRVPYRKDVLRLEIKAIFTVLVQWDLPTIEYLDIFPFNTLDPRRWFYEGVIYLSPKGDMMDIAIKDDVRSWRGRRWEFRGTCFFAMLPSERGNILMLIRNPKPEGIVSRAVLCCNWIDLHLDFVVDEVPIPKGSTYEVEMVIDIYGDGKTTKEEIIEIGRRAMAIGDIVYG